MKKIFLIIALLIGAATTASAVKMSDLKIYINPGHGGYDSDDRPIQIYPFGYNDPAGYWESKSNLVKGKHMYNILDSLGAKPYLSRTQNRTEDDRSLSGIAAECNNLGCDLFFSIHSNAGESVNYPLMLYRENAVGTPRYPEAVRLSNLLWDNLHSSKLSIWTRDKRYVSGDLTFYPQWGTQGLGVLRKLYVVGLLSEGGMHEHRPEAHRLMSDDFCWLEAWHFVRTIMEFYNTDDRFVTGNIAGVVYDNNNTRENTLDITFFSAYGRDVNRPLNGVKTELIDSSNKVVRTHITDDMNNGVYLFRNVAPGSYTIRTTIDGYHSKESKVTVAASEVTYCDVPLVQIQTEPLRVLSYSPNVAETEKVNPVNPIVINFNQDIDPATFEKAFTLTPACDCVVDYSKSNSTVTISPKIAFDRNTMYEVRVSEALETPDKTSAMCRLAEPLRFVFGTLDRNKLDLLGSFPAEGGSVHYQGATLEFRFDGRLNGANLFTKLISVYDKNGTRLPFNTRQCKSNTISSGYGNAIAVLSKDLVPGEKYRVVLSAEIKDVDGIPLSIEREFNFAATDESHPEADGEVLIEPFESEGVLGYLGDESAGVVSDPQFYLNVTKQIFGKGALQVAYKFSDTRDGYFALSYLNGMKIVQNGDKVGLHVYGDMNGHELHVGFTAGTDTKYAKVCNVDFVGWHYYEVSTDMLELNVDYLLSHIKLVQKPGAFNTNGALYFDNILSVKTSGVVDAVADDGIVLSYDKASRTVVVNGTDETPLLRLYNMQGALIASRVDAEMVLSDIPAGAYMLAVSTRTKNAVKKLVVY